MNNKIYVLSENNNDYYDDNLITIKGIFTSKETLWVGMEGIEKEDAFFSFCVHYDLEPSAKTYCRWLNDSNNKDLFEKVYKLSYCPLNTFDDDMIEDYEIQFPVE